jgi:glucose-1-phosphate adenylyltransferase
MQRVLAVILGGGRGTRLHPLTKNRAKPALPLAGKYRLIDIPVSNCINTGIQKIYVLTQFNSASLNQHITNTFRFSPFSNGFVQVLAAQQTYENPDWFQGTADAVRKTVWMMENWKVDEYLILSGDHLYRMDYRPFIEHHRNTNADITISVIPVDEKRASGFGILKTDSFGRIVEFREKPHGPALDAMKLPTPIRKIEHESVSEFPYIASMGIYVFRREALYEILRNNPQFTDFGKHIIPAAISSYNVQSYVYDGYWEDIGTIDSFFHANIELVRQPLPKFSFFDEQFPIYTRPRFLPPSKVLNCDTRETMICDGCMIRGSRIHESIIGIRSRIEDDVTMRSVLMMGADYYQSNEDRELDKERGVPAIGIGSGSVIEQAIIDKNVRIGKNVKIVAAGRTTENVEREGYSIIDGIVVVTKDSIIPDNTVIA